MIAMACALQVGLGNALGFVFYELAKDVLSVDGRTPPWERAGWVHGSGTPAAARVGAARVAV